jgi:DNA-binding transcriptional LysR family regulator
MRITIPRALSRLTMGSTLTDHLASGTLVRVLRDWCPPFPGFFLYYPSQKQQPAALAALVEMLRMESTTVVRQQ